MTDIEKAISMAEEAGFTHAAPLDPATIELKDEVRAMSAPASWSRVRGNWRTLWTWRP